MPWIAALALAVSLLAGCDSKDRSPAPVADPRPGSSSAPTPPAAPPATPTPPAAPPATPAPAAPAGPELPAAEALRRITALADQICKCPDRACVEAAHAAFQQENQHLASRLRVKPTQAEADAMQAQARRFSECLRRLP